MLLKKLNIFTEQVITYLQKDGKLSKEECGAAMIAAGDCGGTETAAAGMTTGQTFGPDTPQTSIANTMKQPPKCPHHHGRAGITIRNILPMYIPALPYRPFRFLKKKKKRKKKKN